MAYTTVISPGRRLPRIRAIRNGASSTAVSSSPTRKSAAGHVPGAFSFPYARLISDDERLLPEPELTSEIATMSAPRGIENAVFYWGSGVTSAHRVLAIAHATGEVPKLYAGSWNDWITDPRRPVERGEPAGPD